MRSNLGRLIVFEGIDGSGKTTVSRLFHEYIKSKGIISSWLREPSDSKWGRKIRELANSHDSIPIKEELSYFINDRKWDIKNNINPALSQGKTVILDRYYFSTACYQGARGLDMGTIIEENLKFAPEPDLLFLIDIDVSTALKRIENSRENEAILFEKENFLKKVRKNYLSLKYNYLKLIDGRGKIEEILSLVIDEFNQFFLP